MIRAPARFGILCKAKLYAPTMATRPWQHAWIFIPLVPMLPLAPWTPLSKFGTISKSIACKHTRVTRHRCALCVSHLMVVGYCLGRMMQRCAFGIWLPVIDIYGLHITFRQTIKRIEAWRGIDKCCHSSQWICYCCWHGESHGQNVGIGPFWMHCQHGIPHILHSSPHVWSSRWQIPVECVCRAVSLVFHACWCQWW